MSSVNSTVSFFGTPGGDKKALGIVLTPRHVTELFALLANVQKYTRVLDICAGTGGFLIASMHQMMRQAVTQEDKEYIKKHRLIGVEQQPNMYALAASNMLLRGDGKANLFQGSCFDEGIVAEVRRKVRDGVESGLTDGMLNPPYSQGDDDLHELAFAKQILDCLVPGGVGIAIIPLQKVSAPHPIKQELLKHHTLDAVMTMPHELFYPVGRVPCVVVFTAHTQHDSAKRKTWFGYWKDDGLEKTKHKGRIDLRHRWEAIRDSWVSSNRNRDEIPGVCFKRHVTAAEEWCPEAFMETDYNAITPRQLGIEIKRYIVHSLMADEEMIRDSEEEDDE